MRQQKRLFYRDGKASRLRRLPPPLREDEVKQAVACWRKRRYPSEAAAAQAAAERSNGAAIGVYPCRWCHGWHMTRHVRESGSGRAR